LRASLAVNRELVFLYWQIGRDILARQEQESWGTKVIDRLAGDLKAAFPEMKGFSPRNLKYMRALAEAWPEEAIVQQLLHKSPGATMSGFWTVSKIPQNESSTCGRQFCTAGVVTFSCTTSRAGFSGDRAGLMKVFNAEDGRGLGLRATNGGELAAAIEKAIAHSGGPAMIECTIDRDDCTRQLLEWGSRVAIANARPPRRGCMRPPCRAYHIRSATASTRPTSPTPTFMSRTRVALAMLGPGAYSVDAKLFGRRKIVFPPRGRGDRN
jgi:DUF1016 N-terminal domain